METATTPAQQVAIRFAQELHAANIPNVLWGQCLLNVYGVPSIISVGWMAKCKRISLAGNI